MLSGAKDCVYAVTALSAASICWRNCLSNSGPVTAARAGSFLLFGTLRESSLNCELSTISTSPAAFMISEEDELVAASKLRSNARAYSVEFSVAAAGANAAAEKAGLAAKARPASSRSGSMTRESFRT